MSKKTAVQCNVYIILINETHLIDYGNVVQRISPISHFDAVEIL